VSEKSTVVVLGASPKPERYSNKAVRLLTEKGHHVVPVRPGVDSIEGLPAVGTLAEVAGEVDTLTVYVSGNVSAGMERAILDLAPRRVIFNPGAENPQLRTSLVAAGIETVEACTLVMLGTGQF